MYERLVVKLEKEGNIEEKSNCRRKKQCLLSGYSKKSKMRLSSLLATTLMQKTLGNVIK
ncbi:hypothetical protein AAZX31_14G053400 [Glycine max]|nr:hypothetical protein JHK86_039060 [Glycine max]